MNININAVTLRLADWLKDELLPKLFEGRPIAGFLSGVFSGAIAAEVIKPFAPHIESAKDLTPEDIRKKINDGFDVTKDAPLPFSIGHDKLPEPFRGFAHLVFDMSLPDPSVKFDLNRDDINKILDYILPKTITTEVTL